MWCPLPFECEIVSGAVNAAVTPTRPTRTFNTSITATSWQLQDAKLIDDAVTLDSGLQTHAQRMLYQLKAYQLSYNTYAIILQDVAFPTVNVSVTRAVTRLTT